MRPTALIVAIASTQLFGCASIVNGQNQSVSVETRIGSDPVSGASCKLSNDKGAWYVTSPGSVTVHRSYAELSVRCEKEPFEPGLASIKSSTKGMAFGNILFGGVIGAGVDMSTGAAYDYPTTINVALGSHGNTGGAPAPASPASGAALQPVTASGQQRAEFAAPAGVIHLRTDSVVGKTWVYPHPSDPAKFGNIELAFSSDGVSGHNKRSTTRGSYEIQDDLLCIQMSLWGKSCYFMIDDGGTTKLLFPGSGRTVDVTVR